MVFWEEPDCLSFTLLLVVLLCHYGGVGGSGIGERKNLSVQLSSSTSCHVTYSHNLQNNLPSSRPTTAPLHNGNNHCDNEDARNRTRKHEGTGGRELGCHAQSPNSSYVTKMDVLATNYSEQI